MPAFIDRTGQRFGRLLVVSRAENAGPRVRWACRCDCGKEAVVLASGLRVTVSCGCYHRERVGALKTNLIHGGSKTREYNIWLGIRRRCNNSATAAFPRYGGRGVKVCERWQSFEAFRADMGQCPEGYEIDRIDVNGNYEPGNCRWASLVTQANNKRSNRLVAHSGRVETVAQYARRSGLDYHAAYYREVTKPRMQLDSGPKLEWD